MSSSATAVARSSSMVRTGAIASLTGSRRSRGQEVEDEAIELGRVLDLGPVAAAVEDMEPRIGDQAEHLQRGIDRRRAVVLAPHDERRVGQTAQVLVEALARPVAVAV